MVRRQYSPHTVKIGGTALSVCGALLPAEIDAAYRGAKGHRKASVSINMQCAHPYPGVPCLISLSHLTWYLAWQTWLKIAWPAVILRSARMCQAGPMLY